MLIASLRELRTHAEKMRAVVAPLIPSGSQLAAQVAADRSGKQVNVHVRDNFEDQGRSSFGTRLSGVLGSYYELWQLSAPDKYCLSRGYLHLVASSSPNGVPDELLFVHTEPQRMNATADEKAKRLVRWRSGPHLHVKASRYALGRCHFHLDSLSSPSIALQSLAKYRESLQVMIEMIADELEEYFDLGQT